jgi:hypothetical protein
LAGDSFDNTLGETINGLYKTELIRTASPTVMNGFGSLARSPVGVWFDLRL